MIETLRQELMCACLLGLAASLAVLVFRLSLVRDAVFRLTLLWRGMTACGPTVAAAFSLVMVAALADDMAKPSAPDWDRICFAITNTCVQEENSGSAWMAIANAKRQYDLSSEQMLHVLRRCLDGLGDTPRESLACRRIVESMSSLCGTNALPYVEYLIATDSREGIAYEAYRQLLRMNKDLDRRLIFAGKLLDAKAGHDDSARIAVYRDLCKMWKQADNDGDSLSKAKLTSFFKSREPTDKDFDRLAPKGYLEARRAAIKVDGVDWDGICYAISNVCIRSRHSEPAWETIAAVKVRYKLNADQMLEAFKRCIEGLGDTLNETMACERIVHCMSGSCGTNALPYVEYLIENDNRDGVVACAYLELVKMEPSIDRKLFFSERILDRMEGSGNSSRFFAYRELRRAWTQIDEDGDPSRRAKLTSILERRRLLDNDFKYLAPQDFIMPRKEVER